MKTLEEIAIIRLRKLKHPCQFSCRRHEFRVKPTNISMFLIDRNMSLDLAMAAEIGKIQTHFQVF